MLKIKQKLVQMGRLLKSRMTVFKQKYLLEGILLPSKALWGKISTIVALCHISKIRVMN